MRVSHMTGMCDKSYSICSCPTVMPPGRTRTPRRPRPPAAAAAAPSSSLVVWSSYDTDNPDEARKNKAFWSRYSAFFSFPRGYKVAAHTLAPLISSILLALTRSRMLGSLFCSPTQISLPLLLSFIFLESLQFFLFLAASISACSGAHTPTCVSARKPGLGGKTEGKVGKDTETSKFTSSRSLE